MAKIEYYVIANLRIIRLPVGVVSPHTEENSSLCSISHWVPYIRLMSIYYTACDKHTL